MAVVGRREQKAGPGRALAEGSVRAARRLPGVRCDRQAPAGHRARHARRHRGARPRQGGQCAARSVDAGRLGASDRRRRARPRVHRVVGVRARHPRPAARRARGVAAQGRVPPGRWQWLGLDHRRQSVPHHARCHQRREQPPDGAGGDDHPDPPAHAAEARASAAPRRDATDDDGRDRRRRAPAPVWRDGDGAGDRRAVGHHRGRAQPRAEQGGVRARAALRRRMHRRRQRHDGRRDENLHVAITQNIMKNWINNPDEGFQDIVKKNESKIYDAYEMAVNAEKDWADYLFSKGSLIGLTAESLKNYIEWLANNRLTSLGYKKLYPNTKTNPLAGWLDSYYDSKKLQVAPQETELSSYVKGIDNTISENAFDDFKL